VYKRILVPLDGSRKAEAILPHVEALSVNLGSEIILLQVIGIGRATSAPHDAEVDVNARKKRAEKATDYLAGIGGGLRAKGIEHQHFVEYGSAVDMIIQVAERVGADLIAMASHGRGGLSRVFYGSVAAGVMQQVDRPLLIIRSRRVD
jgi:nucleotide-binding universal stress UspA family protein